MTWKLEGLRTQKTIKEAARMMTLLPADWILTTMADLAAVLVRSATVAVQVEAADTADTAELG